MTVFELESALVEFIAQNTSELRFRSNEQTSATVSPKVYSGYVPRDEVGSLIPGEITVFPVIIVSAQSGEQRIEKEIVTVNFVIGCYDAELDQQGYRDCCNLTQRLKDRFREIDIIAETFVVSKESLLLNWQLNKRSASNNYNNYPYFFAEMQINFELPVAMTQFDITAMDGDIMLGRYNEYPIPTST